MERQVFKRSFTNILVTLIFVTFAVVVIYNTTKIPYVFFILLVFVIVAISSIKNKLVIEHGKIYLEKLMFSKEISLEDVSQINLERMDTVDAESEKTSEKYVAVYRKNGEYAFKFPSIYVSGNNKQRFINAVHDSNPEIFVHLEPNVIDVNILMQEYKEYRKGKKRSNEK